MMISRRASQAGMEDVQTDDRRGKSPLRRSNPQNRGSFTETNLKNNRLKRLFLWHSLQKEGNFSITLWQREVPARMRKSNNSLLLILYLLNNIYIYSKKRDRYSLRAGHFRTKMLHSLSAAHLQLLGTKSQCNIKVRENH